MAHPVKRIVILGESGVGKTCVTDMFLKGTHFTTYDPSSEFSSQRILSAHGETWTLDFTDINTSLLDPPDPNLNMAYLYSILSKADGFVLLYDINSKSSYDLVTTVGYMTVWGCRRERRSDGERYAGGKQRFGCVVVGNKLDIAEAHAARQVSKALPGEWAAMQGFRGYEVDANNREQLEEMVRGLMKSIMIAEKRDAADIERTKKEREEVEGVEAKAAETSNHNDTQTDSKGKGKERSGLSSSMSRLRNALPSVLSRSKKSTT